MRIVVDTNIVFSAILNTNSKISKILLHPKSRLNFYSTELLLIEVEEHRLKLKQLTDYSDIELNKVIKLVTKRIRFVNIQLIPSEILLKAENLTKDVDIDDTEFIGLTEHVKGKFWSGDKELRHGLIQKDWNRFITTDELFRKITKQ